MTASPLAEQCSARSVLRAYGVELSCEFREIGGLWAGDGELVHETLIADDTVLRIERAAAGDHLIRCGRHRFHLSADRSRLVCRRPSRPDPLWWGALLDWVPYSAATLSGLLCIHAAGVLIDGRVLAVAADSGAGKSTLAAELLAAGGSFFCDDVLALEPTADAIVAHPGPPLAKVDAARAARTRQLGRPLGRTGDEVLVEVSDPASDPAPVAAVVILERSAGGPEQPCILDEGLVALRRLAVGLPCPESSERDRFETLTALAAEAAIVRLQAHVDVPATILAQHLLTGLPEPAAR